MRPPNIKKRSSVKVLWSFCHMRNHGKQSRLPYKKNWKKSRKGIPDPSKSTQNNIQAWKPRREWRKFKHGRAGHEEKELHKRPYAPQIEETQQKSKQTFELRGKKERVTPDENPLNDPGRQLIANDRIRTNY